MLDAAPLHHSFGLDVGMLAPFLCGATMYLEDEVSSKRLTKLLRDERIDVFPGSPPLFGGLAREVAVKPLQVKKARFLSSGSPLPTALADSFYERFRVRLLSCYHATETGPITLEKSGKEPAAVGKPLEGVEIRLGPGDGGPAAGPDTPQPIWVRSSGTSRQFVPPVRVPLRAGTVPIGSSDPEGWFHTGDLGYQDRAGRLILRGREDDLVKIDGKRVALGEVAGCLESFAKVREAEARLSIDEAGNPTMVARVVAAPGCRADDLIDHCARSLAPHKVPRQIEFCESI